MWITTYHTSVRVSIKKETWLKNTRVKSSTPTLTHHCHLFHQQLQIKPSKNKQKQNKLFRLTVIASGAVSVPTDWMARVWTAVRWLPRHSGMTRYVWGMSCDHALIGGCRAVHVESAREDSHSSSQKKQRLLPSWSRAVSESFSSSSIKGKEK